MTALSSHIPLPSCQPGANTRDATRKLPRYNLAQGLIRTFAPASWGYGFEVVLSRSEFIRSDVICNGRKGAIQRAPFRTALVKFVRAYRLSRAFVMLAVDVASILGVTETLLFLRRFHEAQQGCASTPFPTAHGMRPRHCESGIDVSHFIPAVCRTSDPLQTKKRLYRASQADLRPLARSAGHDCLAR